MDSLVEKLRFGDESCKILKPGWTVASDYLATFLLAISIFLAAMELTVKFECRPVVDCPAKSNNTNNISIFPSQLQHRNICEEYYSSQRAGTVEGKEVLSDIANAVQYSSFVNSECSKSARAYFMAYFSVMLLIQTSMLIAIDKLWLKMPPYAPVVEHFTALAMECYALPSLRNDRETRVSRIGDDTTGQTGNNHHDISTDAMTAAMSWYRKVTKLQYTLMSIQEPYPLRWFYLIQAITQCALAIVCLIVDITFGKDLQETVKCTTAQYIPVPHDYFLCSHDRAPAFVFGLYLYLFVLVARLLFSIFTVGWTLHLFYRKGLDDIHIQIHVYKTEAKRISEDLCFLLHLLLEHNKFYAFQFTTYLEKCDPHREAAQVNGTQEGRPCISDRPLHLREKNNVYPYTASRAPHIDLTNLDRIYKMDSAPKGIAVIFNVYLYADTNKYPDRVGSEKDVSALVSLFKQIGFQTAVYRNKTNEEAKKILKERAEDKNYEECDCIAVIIMSRGDEKGLVFSDGNLLTVGEVVKIVQDSPLYQEKPKLFFVQACGCTQMQAAGPSSQAQSVQSDTDDSHTESVTELSGLLEPRPSRNDEETTVTSLSDDDDDTATPVMVETLITPDLPEEDDILLSFSTLQGYVSSSSTEFGTCYVQTLVKMFSKHAWKEDVLSLLTLVNYEEARRSTSSEWRQMLFAPVTTLRKKLYLLPGYHLKNPKLRVLAGC